MSPATTSSANRPVCAGRHLQITADLVVGWFETRIEKCFSVASSSGKGFQHLRVSRVVTVMLCVPSERINWRVVALCDCESAHQVNRDVPAG